MKERVEGIEGGEDEELLQVEPAVDQRHEIALLRAQVEAAEVRQELGAEARHGLHPPRIADEAPHGGVAHDLDVAAQRQVLGIGIARLDELQVRVPGAVLLERVGHEAAPLRAGGSNGERGHAGRIVEYVTWLARASSSSPWPSFSASPRASSPRTSSACRRCARSRITSRPSSRASTTATASPSPSTRSRSASSSACATSRRGCTKASWPPRMRTSSSTAASIRRRSSAPPSKTSSPAAKSRAHRR